MLELLIIAFIIVFITDLSGVVDNIHRLIWYCVYKNKPYNSKFRIKILSCSLCQTFWVGLLYLLFVGKFGVVMIGYVCLLAFLTPVFQDMLLGIKDILIRLTRKL